MTGNERNSPVRRRRFLLVSSALAAGVAGCLGDGDDDEDETDVDEETDDANTDDADESEGDQQDGEESETRRSSDNEVSPVDIQAEDAAPSDSTASLQVSYSTETRTELETDPPTVADDGFKFVLIEVNITNVGDEVYEISPSRYVLRIDDGIREDEIYGDDGVYTSIVTDEFRILQGEDISPGESDSGELAFIIPEETSKATLSVRDDVDIPRPVTIMFTQTE